MNNSSNIHLYYKIDQAYNPNTPPKALEQLATDEDSGVRYWVARNPNTPHYIKKYLKIQEHLREIMNEDS